MLQNSLYETLRFIYQGKEKETNPSSPRVEIEPTTIVFTVALLNPRDAPLKLKKYPTLYHQSLSKWVNNNITLTFPM